MIEILLVIILIAWLTGWRFYPAGGGLIHLLLVLFIIILVLRLLGIV